MTKIKMSYEWYDEDKTAVRYILLEDWNWRDYHAGIRASLFSMMNHPHLVDSVIDLREHQRPKMPAGLAAHMSSFGKKLNKVLSGNAVVIGLADTDRQALPLDTDGTLPTIDGAVYFADDDKQAQHILQQLRANYGV
ncbi:MAG: hypothetical protein Q9P01_05435 [Anaerolineae bacterium]|nr:hypothetical protein [Anaerolineae bacterium]MDQ7034281.1 hypothetical protein [Anaerolineae bacterium]